MLTGTAGTNCWCGYVVIEGKSVEQLCCRGRQQEHHDILLSTLPAVGSTLQRFADVLNQYEIVSAFYNRTDQERSNLIFLETSAKAIVSEATSNLEKTRTSFKLQAQEFGQTKSVVAEKALEAATWIKQHGRIIDALRSSSIPEIKSHIQLTGKEKFISLTSAVLVVGVPFTVVPEPTQVPLWRSLSWLLLLLQRLLLIGNFNVKFSTDLLFKGKTTGTELIIRY